MGLKKFYFSLWVLLILMAMATGSCLEYGHSCWGAHGKRSGNSKIYHTLVEIPTDREGINEQNTIDSTEEQINGYADSLSSAHVMNKDSDEFIEEPVKDSMRFKKFLYKKLYKTKGKQQNSEPPVNDMKKTDNMAAMTMIGERWRRFPLYNLRNTQNARPSNEWLREFEEEQQLNVDDYI